MNCDNEVSELRQKIARLKAAGKLDAGNIQAIKESPSLRNDRRQYSVLGDDTAYFVSAIRYGRTIREGV